MKIRLKWRVRVVTLLLSALLLASYLPIGLPLGATDFAPDETMPTASASESAASASESAISATESVTVTDPATDSLAGMPEALPVMPETEVFAVSAETSVPEETRATSAPSVASEETRATSAPAVTAETSSTSPESSPTETETSSVPDASPTAIPNPNQWLASDFVFAPVDSAHVHVLALSESGRQKLAHPAFNGQFYFPAEDAEGRRVSGIASTFFGGLSSSERLYSIDRIVEITIPAEAADLGQAYLRDGENYAADAGNKQGLLEGFTKLVSLRLPEALVHVPERLAKGTSLRALALGSGVRTIGAEAFANTRLTSLDIPNHVESIGEKAFFYSELGKLSFGTGLRSIGSRAFYLNHLTSEESHIVPDGLQSLAADAFSAQLKSPVFDLDGQRAAANALYHLTGEADFSLSALALETPSQIRPNDIQDVLGDGSRREGLEADGATFNYGGFRFVLPKAAEPTAVPTAVPTDVPATTPSSDSTAASADSSATAQPSATSASATEPTPTWTAVPAPLPKSRSKRALPAASTETTAARAVGNEAGDFIIQPVYSSLANAQSGTIDGYFITGLTQAGWDKLNAADFDGSIVFPSQDASGNPIKGVAVHVFGEYNTESRNSAIAKLTTVTIPEGMSELGYDVRMETENGTSFLTGGWVSRGLFDGFSRLNSLSLPSTLVNIPGYLARGTALSSVTLSDSVTFVGPLAFAECPNLTSLNLGNSVTSISDYAFASSRLTTLSLPNSLQTIATGAFYFNELSEVSFGSGLLRIEDRAFYLNHLDPVNRLKLPTTLTSIGADAFSAQLRSAVPTVNGQRLTAAEFYNSYVPNFASRFYTDQTRLYTDGYSRPNGIQDAGPGDQQTPPFTSPFVPDSRSFNFGGFRFLEADPLDARITFAMSFKDTADGEVTRTETQLLPNVYAQGQTYTLALPYRQGYHCVDGSGTVIYTISVAVPTGSAELSVPLTYIKDAAAVTDYRLCSISTLEQGAASEMKIVGQRTGVRMRLLTSAGSPTLVSPRLVVPMETENIQHFDLARTAIPPLAELDAAVAAKIVSAAYDNSLKAFVIQLADCPAGTDMTIPVHMYYKLYETPNQYHAPMQAYVLDQSGQRIMDTVGSAAVAATLDAASLGAPIRAQATLIAGYEEPELRKYVGETKSADLSLVNPGTLLTSSALLGQNYVDPANTLPITYSYDIVKAGANGEWSSYQKFYSEQHGLPDQGYGTAGYSLDRHLDRFELTDEIPQYLDKDGQLRRAEFRPAENPDWTVVETATQDGLPVASVVRYVQSAPTGGMIAAGGTEANLLLPHLKLRFPNALAQQASLTNRAEARMTPHNQAAYEPAIGPLTDEVALAFSAGENNGQFFKSINGPHTDAGGAYFYSGELWRFTPQWTLGYRNLTVRPVKALTLTDHTLDDRLKYTCLSYPLDLSGRIESVKFFNAQGLEIGTNTSEYPYVGRTDFSPLLNDMGAAKKMQIIFREDFVLQPGETLSLELSTEVEKGWTPDPPPDFDLNFFNYLDGSARYADGDEASFSAQNIPALLRMRREGLNQAEVIKRPYFFGDPATQNHSTVYQPGEVIWYELGVKYKISKASLGANIQLVDFIPDALELEGIYDVPYSSQGGHVEPTGYVPFGFRIVPNYLNSGLTAVVYESSGLVVGERTHRMCVVKTRVRPSASQAFYENVVQFRADNVELLHAAPDSYGINGGQPVSEARLPLYIVRAEALAATKEIRPLGQSAWSSTGIQTGMGEAFEYRLSLDNQSAQSRREVKIYDLLPYAGDPAIAAGSDGSYPARSSQFANRLSGPVRFEDASYAEQYDVYYSSDPVGTANSDSVPVQFAIASRNWTQTPTDYSAVTAIRLEMKSTGELAAGASHRFILPMQAPDAALFASIGGTTNPNNSPMIGDSISLKRAWNSFAWKDALQADYAEAPKVYNEVVDSTITVTKMFSIPGLLDWAVYEAGLDGEAEAGLRELWTRILADYFPGFSETSSPRILLSREYNGERRYYNLDGSSTTDRAAAGIRLWDIFANLSAAELLNIYSLGGPSIVMKFEHLPAGAYTLEEEVTEPFDPVAPQSLVLSGDPKAFLLQNRSRKGSLLIEKNFLKSGDRMWMEDLLSEEHSAIQIPGDPTWTTGNPSAYEDQAREAKFLLYSEENGLRTYYDKDGNSSSDPLPQETVFGLHATEAAYTGSYRQKHHVHHLAFSKIPADRYLYLEELPPLDETTGLPKYQTFSYGGERRLPIRLSREDSFAVRTPLHLLNKQGLLRVQKMDESTKAAVRAAGYKFMLVGPQGGAAAAPRYYAETNADGLAEFDALPPGNYQLYEVGVPEGSPYQPKSQALPFVVPETYERLANEYYVSSSVPVPAPLPAPAPAPDEAPMVRAPASWPFIFRTVDWTVPQLGFFNGKAELEITKVDQNGAILAGDSLASTAEFELFQWKRKWPTLGNDAPSGWHALPDPSDSGGIFDWISLGRVGTGMAGTPLAGIARFPDLMPGEKYQLVETRAPEGYMIDGGSKSMEFYLAPAPQAPADAVVLTRNETTLEDGSKLFSYRKTVRNIPQKAKLFVTKSFSLKERAYEPGEDVEIGPLNYYMWLQNPTFWGFFFPGLSESHSPIITLSRQIEGVTTYYLLDGSTTTDPEAGKINYIAALAAQAQAHGETSTESKWYTGLFFDNLPLGTYTLHEEVLAGYKPVPDQTIELTTAHATGDFMDAKQETIVNEADFGVVFLQKYFFRSGDKQIFDSRVYLNKPEHMAYFNALETASFVLYTKDANGQKLYYRQDGTSSTEEWRLTATTDHSGMNDAWINLARFYYTPFFWSKLPLGQTYYLEEVAPPIDPITGLPRYQIPSGPISFTLDDNLSLFDLPLLNKQGLVEVTKKDGKSGATVAQAGFKFLLTGPEGAAAPLQRYAETDATGVARFDGLPPGRYEIYEVALPEASPYILKSQPVTVEISPSYTYKRMAPYETEWSGKEKITYNSTEDWAPVQLDFNNDSQELRLFKRDEDGRLITGSAAKFELYQWKAGAPLTGLTDGTALPAFDWVKLQDVETATSGADAGKALIQNLPSGQRYKLVETEAPQGFKLLAQPLLFWTGPKPANAAAEELVLTRKSEEVAGESVFYYELDVENVAPKAALDLYKSFGYMSGGRMEGGYYPQLGFRPEIKAAFFPNLSPENSPLFTLSREVDGVKKYYLPDGRMTLDAEAAQINFLQASIAQAQAAANPMDPGGSVLHFINLPLGEYTLHEIQPANLNLRPVADRRVTLTAENLMPGESEDWTHPLSVDVFNQVKDGGVILNKYFYRSNERIWNPFFGDPDHWNEVFALGETAEFVLYSLDADGQKIYYRKDGSSSAAEVRVSVTSELTEKEREHGINAFSYNGIVSWANLPLERTYYLEELASPLDPNTGLPRYQTPSGPIEIRLEAGTPEQPGTQVRELTVLNKQGGLQLYKTDAHSGAPIAQAGFKFLLAGPEGAAQTQYRYLETDESGSIWLDGLAPGQYQLYEVAVPEGSPYTPKSEPLRFEIKATYTYPASVNYSERFPDVVEDLDWEPVNLTFPNDSQELRLRKTSNGSLITSSPAKFELYQWKVASLENFTNGSALPVYDWVKVQDVETATSGPNAGQATISKLPSGERYKLVEIQAPNGYNKLAADLIFWTGSKPVYADPDELVLTVASEVQGETTVYYYALEVQNVPKGDYPMTGGPGRSHYLRFGALLMAAAAYALFGRRKKQTQTPGGPGDQPKGRKLEVKKSEEDWDTRT